MRRPSAPTASSRSTRRQSTPRPRSTDSVLRQIDDAFETALVASAALPIRQRDRLFARGTGGSNPFPPAASLRTFGPSAEDAGFISRLECHSSDSKIDRPGIGIDPVRPGHHGRVVGADKPRRPANLAASAARTAASRTADRGRPIGFPLGALLARSGDARVDPPREEAESAAAILVQPER